MKKVALTRASRSLADYTSELAGDIVVVMDGKRAVAALIPLEHIDPETLALGSNPEFMALIRRSRREFDRGSTIGLTEMRARVRRMRTATQPKPGKRTRAARGDRSGR